MRRVAGVVVPTLAVRPPRIAGAVAGPSNSHYDRLMAADLRDADPAELRLPPSRLSGADPYKLHRQIARFGNSTHGMPPVWVYEASDGVLEIINGTTRDTRVAKLVPGKKIRVEVIGTLRRPRAQNPKVGDRL